MRAAPSIDVPCGYVVTAQGLSDLVDSERCECEDLLVYDGLMRCRECGTVFGVVWGFNRAPRRRFRSARGE